MPNYHISKKGEPAICKANKIPCKLGNHFANKQAALKHVTEKENNAIVPEKITKQAKYPFPKVSETREFSSKRGKVTLQLSNANPEGDYIHHSFQSWLNVPDKGNVSYVCALVKTASDKMPEPIVIADLETRVDARGQGYSKELQDSISEEFGLPVYYSGSFTPEGWEAFGKHAQYYPKGSNDFDAEPEPGIKFRSMGFVASWEAMVPRYSDRNIEYTDEQREKMRELSENGTFRKMSDKEILWVTE